MLRREQWKLIIPFLAPGLLIYTIFSVYPSLRGIYISFFRWSGLTSNMTFIGMDNFARLWHELSDPADFYNVRLYLSHNAFLVIFSLATVFLGLVAAALIAEKPRGYKAFRVTFFFPNVLALPAIAVLWSMTLNPSFGLVNNALKSVGLEQFALPWLSLQYEMPFFKLGLYTVGFIGIWGGIGWFMILFLAAIQNVPAEYTEAATVDGASKLRIFWVITLPLIWETMRTVLVFVTIGMLSGFALPYVLFERMPQKHADLILSYYYFVAFRERNWGYAAAIVVGIFVVTFIASALAYRFLDRDSVQY